MNVKTTNLSSKQCYSYLIAHDFEPLRLEIQSSFPNYLLSSELSPQDIAMQAGQKILDAGCGTGLLSRFLKENNSNIDFSVDAIDLSDIQLAYGKMQIKGRPLYNGINFQKKSLLDVEKNKYDKVFCRFVFQHLLNPQEVADALKQSLKPGGQLIIIDMDGVINGLKTSNTNLLKQLKIIEENTNFDCEVGKKITNYLEISGFKNISVDTTKISFSDNMERVHEAWLYHQRFYHSKDMLEKLFSTEETMEFINNYCMEVVNPHSELEYTKYIFRATA
ncbi:MAG: class I SAM-dependent methyltransferase [Bacteriovoracia bacterium]